MSRQRLSREAAEYVRRAWVTAHRRPGGLILVDGAEFDVVVTR